MACKSCQEKSLMAKVQSGLISAKDAVINGIFSAKEIIVAEQRLIAKNETFDVLAKERLSICQTCPKRNANFADTQIKDLTVYSIMQLRSNLQIELNAISESENPAYIEQSTLKSGCSLCGCLLFLRAYIDPNSELTKEQKTEGCLWKQ